MAEAFSASAAADPPPRPSRRVRNAVRAVVLVVVVATAAMAAHVLRAPGTYSSEVRVVFLAPSSRANPNALAISSDSLITTAGVVARIVDPNVEPTVSDSVTLAGEGVEHGYSVRLPNSGGQWAVNYDKPQLDVQAVGRSAAEVDATMGRVLERIRRTLLDIQVARGVAPHNMITTSQSPPTVPMYFNRGSRVRALAATLLLGTGLALGAWWILPPVLSRRRRWPATAAG